MRVLITTFGIAALALSACNASDSLAPSATVTAAAPSAHQSGVTPPLALKAGLGLSSDREGIGLHFEERETELDPGEALIMGQALAWAGIDSLMKWGPIDPSSKPVKGWPPPVCDVHSCPVDIALSPKLFESIFGESLPVVGHPEGSPVYSFGFRFLGKEEEAGRRLALKNGIEVIAVDKRIVLRTPERRIRLSPGEALMLSQAVSWAALDIVAPVVPGFPKGWPPPVCDTSSCPVDLAFSPKMFDALFGGELPFANQDPRADPVYSFGFRHRPLVRR